MIKAALFALDNTLYPESEYHQSGMKHVAEVLGDSTNVLELLTELDHVTDDPIKHISKLLLAEYYTHNPDIAVYPDVLSALEKLSEDYLLGLVTCDTTGAQIHKIDALGLAPYFDHVTVATPPHIKPTRRPYLDTLSTLDVNPEETVYVASDLGTDLYGARRVGMTCVYLDRAGKKQETFDEDIPFKPDSTICSLAELAQMLSEPNCAVEEPV